MTAKVSAVAHGVRTTAQKACRYLDMVLLSLRDEALAAHATICIRTNSNHI